MQQHGCTNMCLNLIVTFNSIKIHFLLHFSAHKQSSESESVTGTTSGLNPLLSTIHLFKNCIRFDLELNQGLHGLITSSKAHTCAWSLIFFKKKVHGTQTQSANIMFKHENGS